MFHRLGFALFNGGAHHVSLVAGRLLEPHEIIEPFTLPDLLLKAGLGIRINGNRPNGKPIGWLLQRIDLNRVSI